MGSLTAGTVYPYGGVVPSLLHRLLDGGFEVKTEEDRLFVGPPARLTPALKAEVTARKPELLAVVSRLQGMRATVGQVPIPCAVLEAVGGAGTLLLLR